jgi:hypothetical protein
MLGLGACMGLRALGRVNLGKFLGAEKSTDKRIFLTVEEFDHIQPGFKRPLSGAEGWSAYSS